MYADQLKMFVLGFILLNASVKAYLYIAKMMHRRVKAYENV